MRHNAGGAVARAFAHEGARSSSIHEVPTPTGDSGVFVKKIDDGKHGNDENYGKSTPSHDSHSSHNSQSLILPPKPWGAAADRDRPGPDRRKVFAGREILSFSFLIMLD